MKITALLVLITSLQVSANGFGQKITLSEKNASLSKVFAIIEKQSGYSFIYKKEILTKASPVNINVKEAEINSVLEILFLNQPFSYKVFGDNMIAVQIKEAIIKPATANQNILIEIKGRVTDVEGYPLSGANIKIVGTTRGTTTNLNGEYMLTEVEESANLEISFIGYDTRIVGINFSRTINTILAISNKILDETLVKGYYTTTQRLNTGNVTTIKASVIEKQPVSNVLLALEGRVPGLYVTQNNGISGGGVTVRIQGQNSIQSGNDPLYVVDGVPINSQLPRTGIDNYILGTSGSVAPGAEQGAGNPLNYINPSDIESIDILKDADATAIYGSRGANGVIIISTKKGKAGKTKFDFNIQKGFGMVGKRLEMLNTPQYLEMRREAYKNDGLAVPSILTNPASTAYDVNGTWDTTRYTDWQKQLIGRKSEYLSLNASVSGGNQNLQYYIGGTFHKETTVFALPDEFADQKGSFHFNIINQSSSQKFSIGLSGNYMIDDNKLPAYDLTKAAIITEPNAPALYSDDGSLNWATNQRGTSTFLNPLSLLYNNYQNRTTNLISRLNLGYKIIPNVEVTSNFGYTTMQTKDYQAIPFASIRPELRPFTERIAFYGSRDINSWSIEPQISYKGTLKRNKLNILFGGTLLNNKSEGGYLRGSGYNSDDVLKNMQAATSLQPQRTFQTDYRYNAVFGRINYNFNDQYILNLTGRRDGSSRFGKENRFHNFWSVGAGWVFSKMSFIQQNMRFLTFGKLRVSYGTTGNDQIGDYSFLSLYSNTFFPTPYQQASGLIPTNLPNSYLQWEETRKAQFGLDIGFFNEDIVANITYSSNNSSNQLLPYSLPSVSGFDFIMSNFPAKVRNTSWEFSLNSDIFSKKNLSWTASFNLTLPNNRLVSFPNLNNSSYNNQLFIGEPLTIVKLFHFLNVDPATGRYQFEDIEGKPTFTPDYLKDKKIFISTLPKYYGGLQNTFKFKSIQFDFLIQFVKQTGFNIKYNANPSSVIMPGNFSRGSSNQPASVYNRWQNPGDNVPIQKYSSRLFNDLWNGVNYMFASDATYGDASFIRFKNLSISWAFPNKWIENLKIQNLRFYIQGQNLFTITKYKGLDPENQDVFSLPPLRMLIAGVQVKF